MIRILFLFFCFNLRAQEATELAPVRVFGADEASLMDPYTLGKVGKEKIKGQQITDVNRALKQTPGVYVREEDGQGLRPNIGLRGTDPDRSKKVVLLEDGILIGPAPYSAPAAYYTPNMNHVESLEIYKGFAATGIGPNSIGGAVDYRTLTISSQINTELKTSYGSFDTWNHRAAHGGPTNFGGYLVQGSKWTSDGFKKLDGGGNTGFEKKDLLSKLRFDLSSPGERLHALELRFGYADENSHETYLGLSQEDFDQKYNRRYRASSLDDMRWAHRQFQLHHEIQLQENTLLSSDVYYHTFHRAWYRLDRFRDDDFSIKEVLRDPETPANSVFYRILKGDLDSSALGGTDGQLIIANNDRTYFSKGVQTKLLLNNREGLGFKPWVFARVHQDQIQRNHTGHIYEMIDGQMVRTRDPVTQDKLDREFTEALTLSAGADWVMDENWLLSPVVRYENANFDRRDQQVTTNNADRNDHMMLFGISLLNKWRQFYSTRMSVNQAATLAGIDPSGSEVREEAVNIEFELRHANPANWFDWQITFFHTYYENLTGTCTVSSGCSAADLDSVFNGGRAKVKGIEAGVSKGLEWGAVFFPLQANITFLDAKFASPFESTSPAWGVGTVNAGDPLLYIPEIQYSFTLGAEWRKLKTDLTAFYQSKVYDQSVVANRQEIAAFGVVDWAAQYQVSKPFQVLVKIDNLLAREYAVGARPFGLRPGKPQAFQVGLTYVF